jgi:CopG family nickel-responsive transcriptional regulator
MMKRFSVSMEEELLARFDDYLQAHAYKNRSEAVRDLIRDAFVKREWNEDGEVIGVISLVYDHEIPQLQSRITKLQHDFHHRIISTTHVHIDHDNCLEVVIVSGPASNIASLANSLQAIRGVRNCNLSVTSVRHDEEAGSGHRHTHGQDTKL